MQLAVGRTEPVQAWLDEASVGGGGEAGKEEPSDGHRRSLPVLRTEGIGGTPQAGSVEHHDGSGEPAS